MRLDDDRLQNSERYEAERKGGSTVGRYEFGEYRIVSGRRAVGESTSRSNRLEGEGEVKQSQALTFTFVGSPGDNTHTEVSAVSHLRYEVPLLGAVAVVDDLVEKADTFSAVISRGSDGARWEMILVTRVSPEIEGFVEVAGFLAGEGQQLEIREVLEWEDGGRSLLYRGIGHEFVLGGRTLAAVQASPDNFKKKFL